MNRAVSGALRYAGVAVLLAEATSSSPTHWHPDGSVVNFVRVRVKNLGNVTATAKVVIHKTGRVEGNIEAAVLVVEEGAVVEGHIKMGKGSGKLKAVEGGSKPAPLELKQD